MKTKALISFALTAKLICVFVFAYEKNLFSHDAAHIYSSSKSVILFDYFPRTLSHFSSPEPKSHGELIIYQSIRRL